MPPPTGGHGEWQYRGHQRGPRGRSPRCHAGARLRRLPMLTPFQVERRAICERGMRGRLRQAGAGARRPVSARTTAMLQCRAAGCRRRCHRLAHAGPRGQRRHAVSRLAGSRFRAGAAQGGALPRRQPAGARPVGEQALALIDRMAGHDRPLYPVPGRLRGPAESRRCRPGLAGGGAIAAWRLGGRHALGAGFRLARPRAANCWRSSLPSCALPPTKPITSAQRARPGAATRGHLHAAPPYRRLGHGVVAGLGGAERRGQPDAFIAGFSGSNAAIADYLVEDVYLHLPDAVRAFLLRTSILDQLSGRCAMPSAAPPTAREILAWLERANLFLDAAGRRTPRRRRASRPTQCALVPGYHSLFSSFLRRSSSRACTTRCRRCRWPPRAGMRRRAALYSAIEHALAAGAVGHALPLLAGSGGTTCWRRGACAC
ncbi:hypothetical protein ACU4GD_40835 [Cupriavidus basilensis]